MSANTTYKILAFSNGKKCTSTNTHNYKNTSFKLLYCISCILNIKLITWSIMTNRCCKACTYANKHIRSRFVIPYLLCCNENAHASLQLNVTTFTMQFDVRKTQLHWSIKTWSNTIEWLYTLYFLNNDLQRLLKVLYFTTYLYI